MLEILVEGEKKKVACGPCIRGHRSSKCNHKDRLLIEVRKPGRPLSACPHPVGSCRCERLVLNYTIPKSSECPCPSGSNTIAEGRVTKPKAKKANAVNPTALQKALETTPETFSQPPAPRLETSVSTSSEGSSSGPSLASSSSSTPMVAAIDSGKSGGIHGATTATKEEDESQLRGSFGILAPQNSDWLQQYDQQMPPPPVPRRAQAAQSCCQPQVQPEPQPQAQAQSSCCQSQQPAQMNVPAPSSCCSTPQNALNRRPSFAQEQILANAFPAVPSGVDTYDITPLDLYPLGHQVQPLAQQTGHIYATPMPVVDNLTNASLQQHNCHCGDGCQCLGCAVHPRNPTTMGYVLYHGGMMMMNQYQNQNGRLMSHFAVPPQQALTFAPNGLIQQPGIPFPGYQYEDLYTNPTPIPMQDPRYALLLQQQQQQQAIWSQHQIAAAPHTPTLEIEQFHIQTPGPSVHTPGPRVMTLPPTPLAEPHLAQSILPNLTMPTHAEREVQSGHKMRAPQRQNSGVLDVAMPAGFSRDATQQFQATFESDSPSQADDDTASTLSPSSYYVQQIAVDCGEEDACSCGDDCICDGCAVHGNVAGASSDLHADLADMHSSGLLSDLHGPDLELDSHHLPTYDLLPATTVPG